MSVQYNYKIASGSRFLSFLRLIRRWRGSVYKVVWPDMLIYLILYFTISFVYRFALDEEGRTTFEKLVIHCARFRNLIPVSFVLGFYVSLVVSRWWDTYQCFPWPDNLACLVATHIPDLSETGRTIRATIMRYINATIAITFTIISPVVRKKMPTLHNLVEEEYLTEEEHKILARLEETTEQRVTYVPVLWACRVMEKAREEGHVTTELGYKEIVREILTVRGKCGSLMGYDSNNIPLVYAQVVSIAVYSYFLFSVLGEQFLDPSKHYPDQNVDLYVPFFGILQLFFYLGWMKVAEALLNPFGSDDHDFDFLSLLKRHRKLCSLLSDPANTDLPASVHHLGTPYLPLPSKAIQGDAYPSLTFVSSKQSQPSFVSFPQSSNKSPKPSDPSLPLQESAPLIRFAPLATPEPVRNCK